MHHFGNGRNIFNQWRLYWMEHSYSQGFLYMIPNRNLLCITSFIVRPKYLKQC